MSQRQTVGRRPLGFPGGSTAGLSAPVLCLVCPVRRLGAIESDGIVLPPPRLLMQSETKRPLVASTTALICSLTVTVRLPDDPEDRLDRVPLRAHGIRVGVISRPDRQLIATLLRTTWSRVLPDPIEAAGGRRRTVSKKGELHPHVSNLKIAIQRLRFESWSFRSQWPSIYLPVARWKHRRAILAIASREGTAPNPDASPPPVGPGTELVVEGFQRSANSFAIAAIRSAEDRPLAIAHHQHVPAQIVAGVRRGIPTVLLIRDPDAAVLSYVIQQPFLTMRQSFRHYIRFYKRVLSVKDAVVVATFEDVTGDFGAVMKRLNHKFGTAFPEFEHTEENVRKCFEDIERHERKVLKPHYDFEAMTARPSARREALRSELLAELQSARVARLRAVARELYATYTSMSDHS